jgi:DNA invertase Pin-like site-specific DNA recombinase
MDALLYARVSQDRSGRVRSVTEQVDELRERVAARGWNVAKVITDEGSASRYSKRKRPGWAQVMERLRSGDVDVLVTWEGSRTTRRMGEWAELRDVLLDHGTLLLAGEELVDFGKPGTSLTGAIKAAVDEDEAERTRQRVLRAMRANAASGRPHGRRLYGYRRVYDDTTGALVGQVPEPAEAAIVAEVVERVARGEAMRAVADDLNARGVATPTGTGAWNGTQVRRIARNAHYAGQRVHRGQVVGDADWPPLVATDLHRAAVARTDRNGHGRPAPSSGAKYLLSGVLICGRCGAPLWWGHDRGRPLYTCRTRGWIDPATGQHHGIGHLSAALGPVDQHVSEVVAAWLDRADVAALIARRDEDTPDPAVARLDELRRRLDDASGAYTRGEISVAMLGKVEAELLPAIADAERTVARAAVPAVVVDALGQDFRGLDVATKREVIRAVVRPVLLPAVRRSRTFDTDRVRFDWAV